MTFIKNMWYVAAWSHELGSDQPIGRMLIGEPIVLYRKSDSKVVTLEDRCPHRHAPLSLGRIMGDDIKCMYHGLRLSCEGVCKSIPGTDLIPPNTNIRAFPTVESDDWIWVWTGDPVDADPKLIPPCTGLHHPDYRMEANALDYDAHYELITDNLTDLSHLDFTHETTLGGSSGRQWQNNHPKITQVDNGVIISRWFTEEHNLPGNDDTNESWSSYRFLLPGLFLMETKIFPEGTAASCKFGDPLDTIKPIFQRREQQAVTPINENTTRYFFASGLPSQVNDDEFSVRLAIINKAFAEDKIMIEAQQRIWNATPFVRQKAFLPQDKAPAMFRRLIASRLKLEAGKQ